MCTGDWINCSEGTYERATKHGEGNPATMVALATRYIHQLCIAHCDDIVIVPYFVVITE